MGKTEEVRTSSQSWSGMWCDCVVRCAFARPISGLTLAQEARLPSQFVYGLLLQGYGVAARYTNSAESVSFRMKTQYREELL